MQICIALLKSVGRVVECVSRWARCDTFLAQDQACVQKNPPLLVIGSAYTFCSIGDGHNFFVSIKKFECLRTLGH